MAAAHLDVAFRPRVKRSKYLSLARLAIYEGPSLPLSLPPSLPAGSWKCSDRENPSNEPQILTPYPLPRTPPP